MQPVAIRRADSDNGILGNNDVTIKILKRVDKGTLASIPRVCRLWHEIFAAFREKLTRSILPVGKSELKVLLSQEMTESLLERFVQDPRALTKIYYFFHSYFADIPQQQRLFSYNTNTNEVTHTGELTCNRIFEHSEIWRPYAQAMSILCNCNVNMKPLPPEVRYPYFTTEERDADDSDDPMLEDKVLVTDYNKVEEQAHLVSSYLSPRSPLFYRTFDHKKNPTRFLELHKAVLQELDPLFDRIGVQLGLRTKVAVNKELALRCLLLALESLEMCGVKSASYANAARKYLQIADEETLSRDEACRYYLQAADCYEKATKRRGEEKPANIPHYNVAAAQTTYHYEAGVAYYNAASCSLESNRHRLYSLAAAHFAAEISNNEKESRDSTYSQYRYAGSAHYYIGEYQKAKSYYIEAKKRQNDPAIDTRLQEIEKKLQASL